jgi:hypothetical protein
MQLAARSTHANVEVYLGSSWAPHGDVSFVVDAHANAKHVAVDISPICIQSSISSCSGKDSKRGRVRYSRRGSQRSLSDEIEGMDTGPTSWRLSRRTAITHTSTFDWSFHRLSFTLL